MKKSMELWRHDHTTGALTGEVSGRTASFALHDHLYTTTPLARLSIAEIYRYAISLVRGTHNVVETHALSDAGALDVQLSWD